VSATLTTIDAVSRAAATLARAGIENASREARLLLALASGRAPESFVLEYQTACSGDDLARFESLVRRRAAHEPLSRLRGSRGFWTLDLAISPDTLDPRPDSETLIEAALAHWPDCAARLRALDLGTGSGALLLALLSEYPNAAGLGVDRLPGAVAMAQQNAVASGLADRAEFITDDWAGDWSDTGRGPADVILANPPYLSRAAMDSLVPEVADFDPTSALDGGIDGLDSYRTLAPVVRRRLKPGGRAFIELGQGQAEAVGALMALVGLRVAGLRRDLGGVERCLVLASENDRLNDGSGGN